MVGGNIKLPDNIRKIFKFFFSVHANINHSKQFRVPKNGEYHIASYETPAGLNAPFYISGSDKPQDMRMCVLPNNFFKNLDDLFPLDNDKEYSYVATVYDDMSYLSFHITIYRKGYIQMLQNCESIGTYIIATCKFDVQKHVNYKI